jgi:hypothetical protein
MLRNRLLVSVLATLLLNSALALDCPDVVSYKPNNLIQFLKAHGRNADPDCVSQAITRLGGFRTPSGADVLLDLLDFQRPESEGEKLHLFDAHDKFPAVPALFSIGFPAVPALLSKLQSGEGNELVRSNGIRALVTIYRDNPPDAIAALMKAAAAAKTETEAVRLESCAKDGVSFCGKTWKDRCEAAITVSNR